MSDLHQRVYRVISKEDWAMAQETGLIPRCGSDNHDGFVHLSTADTMLETAQLYFSPQENPLIIEILASVLGSDLRWESVPLREGKLFPHLYSEGIPLHAVVAQISLHIEAERFILGSRVALHHHS